MHGVVSSFILRCPSGYCPSIVTPSTAATFADVSSMEEKKHEDFGSDGVDEFFGDDVEQEGAQSCTMAERCVVPNISTVELAHCTRGPLLLLCCCCCDTSGRIMAPTHEDV